MKKSKTLLSYYLKYSGFFLIGILANVAVDFAQTFVPEFLGTIVEIVSSQSEVRSQTSPVSCVS